MLRSWTQEEYDAFSQNWSSSADPATFEHKWTDPNSLRIFEIIAENAEHGVWGEGFQGLTDYNQAISLFTSQAAAMNAMGVWEAGASVAGAEFPVEGLPGVYANRGDGHGGDIRLQEKLPHTKAAPGEHDQGNDDRGQQPERHHARQRHPDRHALAQHR